jgi:flagellar L-ring protein FlgH
MYGIEAFRRGIRWQVPVLLTFALATATAAPHLFGSKKNGGKATPTPLDKYITDVESRTDRSQTTPSPGSLFSPVSHLADAFRDLRASQLDDLVTILVSDKASAVSTGTTNTSRKSSLQSGVQSLAGPTKAAGALANLVGMTGNQQLQGQGTTSRGNTLTTNISARVTHVLPNGNLVVEGVKDILVNSERQTVTVRGILRPQDLAAANTIASDRLANLEIHVDGKGVVGDSVRRPFILYRILMGLLPF